MKRRHTIHIVPIWYGIILWIIGAGLSACNSVLPISTPEQALSNPQVAPTRRIPVPTAQSEIRPTPTPEPQSAIQVGEEELKGLVIRFWHNWTGSSGEAVTSLVDDFNLNNPWGILVVEIYQGNLDEIDKKLSQLKDAAERPDLLVGYVHQALVWDKQIGLIDLNDYLLDPVWGYSADERADFYPVFLDYEVVQEKRLGIPAQRSGYVLYYNQGWARELGFVSAPLSSDAFLQQACAAAQANKATQPFAYDGTGGWAISLEHPAILSWMAAFGADILHEGNLASDQDEYTFNQPEVQRTYEFLRKMYDQGCAWMPENPYPETYFAQRKALFASGSVTDIPFFLDALQRAGNHDAWTVLAYPGPDDAQAIDVYGPAFQVLKSSERQQLAAWLLIKWLLQPDNQARLLQTTHSFPLRRSNVQVGGKSSTWEAAVDLLQFAQVEPALSSWSLVRWAISDSATQLFRSYTTLEQTPDLVRYLDQTAGDLNSLMSEEK